MISPELEKMAASPEFKDVAFCKVDVVRETGCPWAANLLAPLPLF